MAYRPKREQRQAEEIKRNTTEVVRGLAQDIAETRRKERFGEITAGEAGLYNTADLTRFGFDATGLSALMEPVGYAAGAVTKPMLSALDPIPSMLSDLTEEYPRVSRALGDTATIAGLFSGANVARALPNKLAKSLDTMLPGFYGYGVGLPGKALAAGKGVLRAAPDAVLDNISPRRIAYERQTGVPYSKGKATGEIGRGEREGEVSLGSAATTSVMKRQMGEKATFIDEGPIGAMDNIEIVPATNKAEVKDQLFTRGKNITVSVPEVVQNRAMNHLYSVHGVDPENTIMKIKSPRGVQNVGAEGVLDGSPQSSSAIRMLSSQDKVKIGERDMPTLSKEEIRKRKIRNALPDAVEKNSRVKELADSKLGTKGKPTTANIEVPSFQAFMKKKKKAVSGATEADLLEYFASNKIKVNKGSKNDPHLYINTSHSSQAKELGGVNDFIAINPKTGDVYTMISDGHDLFGMNPVGGKGAIAAVPMQKSNFKKKKGQKHTQTRNVDKGMDDPKTVQRMQAGAENLESLSGIKREKGENLVNYSMRVLREFDAPVAAKDVATSARRVGMLGLTGSALSTGAEEEGEP
jgi:hypothetical protein